MRYIVLKFTDLQEHVSKMKQGKSGLLKLLYNHM